MERERFILKRDMALAVLIVEGKRGDHPAFSDELQKKGYQVTRASSGRAGLDRLETLNPHVIIVDAASLRTSGVRICQSFRKNDNDLPIILIVDNPRADADGVDANLVLQLPFTVQKLINRMQVYAPSEDKDLVSAGPIALNTETQLVTSYDRQTKLTPRLVDLLQMLIENHGKVVERDHLFTKIWETNYTGDTRTLDVHISWLRQAIEEDPRRPKLIRTIRGVGYILEV